MFEEHTVEKKTALPPPPVEDKPAPKVELEKEKEEPVHERETVDIVKEEVPVRPTKDRERYTTRPPPYGAARTDYPTPSSLDLGYGTQSETYSTNYGSTNTTPIG